MFNAIEKSQTVNREMKDALLLSIFFIRYTTSHTTNIILRKTLELITFFFPLLALLLIQIRFSAYQSLPLTLCHFFMVMTDIFLLLIYWQRVWNPRDNDEEDFQDDGSENKLTQIRVKFCYNKEKMNWKKAYLFIICPPIHLVTYFWQIIKDIHKSRGIFTALEIWSLRLIFLISVMNFLIIIILETEYKKRLYDDHKIIFNHLFCISNMPIGRYLEYLLRSNNYEEYLQLLVNSYNPAAVDNVMC